MAFTGKTAPYKRNENGRGRKRPRKNNTANPFFFLNNDSPPVSPPVPPPILSLISPPPPSPVLPFSPPLIFFFFLPDLPAAFPPILFFNLFHDTRPQAAGAPQPFFIKVRAVSHAVTCRRYIELIIITTRYKTIKYIYFKRGLCCLYCIRVR